MEQIEWTEVINTFIATIPMIIASVASAYAVVRKVKENMVMTKEVHEATNGMKDALVLATAKASEAEGHAAGVLAEQTRVKGVGQ